MLDESLKYKIKYFENHNNISKYIWDISVHVSTFDINNTAKEKFLQEFNQFIEYNRKMRSIEIEKFFKSIGNTLKSRYYVNTQR